MLCQAASNLVKIIFKVNLVKNLWNEVSYFRLWGVLDKPGPVVIFKSKFFPVRRCRSPHECAN